MRFRKHSDVLVTLVLIAVPVAVVGSGSYFLLHAFPHAFVHARKATCLSTHCFCESVRATVLRQPADTWSSLGYCLAGVALLVPRARKLLRLGDLPIIRLLGALLFFIGISSFYYHATLTFVGQFFDIFSMYLLGTFIILAGLRRREWISTRFAISAFVLLNAVLAAVQYTYPDVRRLLFGVILIPGILLEMLPATTGYAMRSREMRPICVAFVALLVAYVFWILDQDGVLCSPHSLFQGHAVWHVLTAVAGTLLAVHYSRTADLTRDRRRARAAA